MVFVKTLNGHTVEQIYKIFFSLFYPPPYYTTLLLYEVNITAFIMRAKISYKKSAKFHIENPVNQSTLKFFCGIANTLVYHSQSHKNHLADGLYGQGQDSGGSLCPSLPFAALPQGAALHYHPPTKNFEQLF